MIDKLKVNRVIKGDSRAVMARFPDKSIGAIISDPPFLTGTSRDGGGFGKDPWVDTSTVVGAADWATTFTKEFARVVRPGGAIVLMCGVHASAAWMLSAERAGLVWLAEIDILWNTGKVRQKNFGSLHTHVLWFARPGARHTWNSHRKSFYSNVIICKKVPIKHRLHISQKPIELTNFLVSLLSQRNDIVCDPFCGAGSTLVSAELAGRHYIGIDEIGVNVDNARKRLNHPDDEEENEIRFWINGREEEI